MNAIIEMTDVRKTYATGAVEVEALRIAQGEYVAVAGPSGSGKSTLMHIIGCLDLPTSGEYVLAGGNVTTLPESHLAELRNRRIGFVFQQFNLLPSLTACRNVELPLAYAGVAPAERRRRAEEALTRVGLADRLTHRPGELSGGQQQRVAVARALVTDPSLILADEPTGNLDSAASADVLGLFDELHAVGRTIVLITHEADVARRAQRSVLTMLGIVIGISSVILTVGLGLGAQDRVRAQIDALGSNLLIVSPGSSTSSSGVRGGFGTASTLTAADAAALADPVAAPDVAAVAPVTTSQAALVAGTTNWTSSLVGTTTSCRPVRDRTLSAGRFLTAADTDVVVLGQDTASELFGGRSAVGQQVTVSGTPMTVVVPLGTARELAGTPSSSVSAIYVQARSEDVLSAAYQEIDALLTNLHGVDDADFSIASQESLLATANATNETLTVLLGGVAAISLLVGGIGVMNIMLVAVTERIREIGLRKALGATPSAIRRQFLVEAGVLGTCGGLLGVVLTVPTSAVRRGVVTVLSGEETSPVRVTVGAVGPTRIEIEGGLSAGDQVVLADLDSPVPTNDQGTGPGGFTGGGPVRMARPMGN